jgi:hypothetical protein
MKRRILTPPDNDHLHMLLPYIRDYSVMATQGSYGKRKERSGPVLPISQYPGKEKLYDFKVFNEYGPDSGP